MDKEKSKVKMKVVSNIMAGVGLLVVVVSFVLNACGITNIAISDALKVGAFCKGVFLPVDVSVWISNVLKGNANV